MEYIPGNGNDPFFNLAAEEYLLQESTGDYFLLWQNDPVIVVGRNQNTLAEINRDAVQQLNVNVIRRLSGGGAVYHDLGNVNYTFITGKDKKATDLYRHFTNPLTAYLQELGVKAEFSGRNDVTVDGKKISGNAQYFTSKRMFHHGTILFDSDLGVLSSVLQSDPVKMSSRAVQSIRGRVTNIRPYLQKDIEVQAFIDGFRDYLLRSGAVSGTRNYSIAEIESIEQLAERRYRQWDWVYGESPDYNIHKKMKFDCGVLEIYIQLVAGLIGKIRFFGDFLGERPIDELEEFLTGQVYKPAIIENVLEDKNVALWIRGGALEDILELLFG